MKAGLAAALHAARALATDPPAGDVIVAAVIDEEWRSAGAEALVTARRELRLCHDMALSAHCRPVLR